MDMDLQTIERESEATNIDRKETFVSERDISLLNFIYQMRFCTSLQIMNSIYFQKFDGTGRTSDLYIKRRLAQLVESGWLNTNTCNNGSRYYFYTTTTKAVRLLAAKDFNVFGTRAPKVNMLHFVHDSLVTNCRSALEKSGSASSWVPEFQIKSMFNTFKKLPNRYIPDGLFINKLGELSAFEMEISRKAVARYQDKVDQYVKIIGSQFNEELPLKRVLYVASTNSVHKILTEMTKPNANIFKVELYSNIIGRP